MNLFLISDSCLKNIQSFFLLLLLFFLSSVSPSFSSTDSVKDRIRICTPVGGTQMGDGVRATPEDLDVGISLDGAGEDIEFELDNPVCQAIIIGAYAGTKVAIAAMNKVCGTGSSVPRIKPSPIQDVIDIAKATAHAASSKDVRCGAAVAAATTPIIAFAVEMEVISEIAKSVYSKAKVCGSNWTRWNSFTMNKDIPDELQRVEDQKKLWIKEGKTERLRVSPISNDNKEYREWIYGGVEKEDNGNNACPDVTRNSDSTSKTTGYIAGKTYPVQRYYFRGSNPPNFNCNKYKVREGMVDPLDGRVMTEDRVKEYNEAYECCINRSKNSICIEYDGTGSGDNYALCNAGTRCTIKGITFSAGFKLDNRLICASTYSLCPFNFNLQGGTTECEYFKDGKTTQDSDGQDIFTPIKQEDVKSGNCNGKSDVRESDCSYNKKAGQCKNYCQMFNHCVIVPDSGYKYQTSISSPYFSSACINFEGDSRNNLEYGASLVSGSLRSNQRNFTAPIAQCVRETLENIFYNKAGHTVCLKPFEVANQEGTCASGTYVYKKNQDVSTYRGDYAGQYKSAFSNLQNRIQDIIRLVLIMAVTLTGMKILLGGANMKRSEIVMFVVKMGLIMYFATGDAWQTKFFEGVYKASDMISSVVVNVTLPEDQNKRDGCQFGTSVVNGVKQDTVAYPAGKEYLAMWDMFDCKITRYLGYGPEMNSANLFILIIAGFFTGPLGIYFSLLLMIFAFFMISAALRALHIFLLSSMSIILMVFVSPLVIPCILFKKTENIFKKWLSNLIGFSLQPIILFAYIGIFISIMDAMVIGSAKFTGSPPNKEIICDKQCLDRNGNQITTMNANEVDTKCDTANGQKIINPNVDSVGCILQFKNTKNFPGFEIIGIGLPTLVGIFTEQGREKILTLAKAALIMFILANFIDEIPGIASNLMGGATLKPEGISGKALLDKVRGVAGAIQTRAVRGSQKLGKSAGNTAQDTARQLGSKEKSSPSSDSGSSPSQQGGDQV